MTHLVLASASPARAATLRAAGVEPEIVVSDVDEEAALAAAGAAGRHLDVGDAVLLLARAKAEAVAQVVMGRQAPERDGVLVLGCDSLLDLDGEGLGKPGTAEVARERWRRMRGRSGVLRTGHWLVTPDGRGRGATSSTTVHFADVGDDEIDAYVATGEPLVVAGAFTLDGRGGAFVTGVEGDPHGVVGISLPLLRTMLAEVGVHWPDLW